MYRDIFLRNNLVVLYRMVMDSVRTIVIWAVSIGVGWQDFVYLQVSTNVYGLQ